MQKKIANLEDMLEDARAASERDEAAILERIKRYKDKEELLKENAGDYKKEIERLVRSEDQAKLRLSESEEAFRENAVTLENARAEIEVLRSELAVSGVCCLTVRVLWCFFRTWKTCLHPMRPAEWPASPRTLC